MLILTAPTHFSLWLFFSSPAPLPEEEKSCPFLSLKQLHPRAQCLKENHRTTEDRNESDMFCARFYVSPSTSPWGETHRKSASREERIVSFSFHCTEQIPKYEKKKHVTFRCGSRLLKQGEITPGSMQRNHPLLSDKEVQHPELPSCSLPQAEGGTVGRQPAGAAPS